MLLTAGLSAGAMSASAGDPAERLLSAVGADQTGPAALGEPRPGEIARRVVKVHWPVLRRLCDPVVAAQPHTLALELFPLVSVTAVSRQISRLPHRSDSLQWRGLTTTGVASGPGTGAAAAVQAVGGRVNLTAIGVCGSSPARPALAGSISAGGRSYRLQPRPGGHTVVIEIDTAAAASPPQPKIRPAPGG